MTAQDIARRVAIDFQSVSPAALRLVGLLGQSSLSNEEVVEVLKLDTSLTAKLLRACNSPSMGFAEPVGSVNQAILLLGHHEILRMVLALTFGDRLARPLSGYAVEAEELWRHSLMVAVAAEAISREAREAHLDASLAFTGGLLHDIGKLGMDQALDQPTQAAVRYLVAEHGQSRVAAERKILGTDHAEIGGCLLSLWNFPEQIIEGVANHHAPRIDPSPGFSGFLCVANWLAHIAGSAPGWDAYALKAPEEVEQSFGLTAQKVEGLVLTVRESFERAESLIKL